MLAIVRKNVLSRSRRTRAAIQGADASQERRIRALAAKDDFYLRAKHRGYDLGRDPDPDGLLPTKYPRKR